MKPQHKKTEINLPGYGKGILLIKGVLLPLVLLAPFISAFGASPADRLAWHAPVDKVLLVMPDNAPEEVSNIARVFTRHLHARAGAEVVREGTAPLTVQLIMDPSVGTESFSIAGEGSSIAITGGDVPGLLFGVGKLLRTSRFDQGGFSAGTWKGKSVPEKPLRGMYWATHYKNTYDVGDITDMKEYIEDTGLLGYNTFFLWYDMSHYRSFEDPLSTAFLDRIVQYLHTAQSIGMRVGLAIAVNHSYYDFAPEKLRATAGHGGNKPQAVHGLFHVCPSTPGGMELILNLQHRYYQHLKDNGISISTVLLWGIDDGGCSCDQCKPWDSNGYLKCAEQDAVLVREIFGAGCKTSLSNWGIDFAAAYRTWAETPPHWLDYVMYTGTPSAEMNDKKLPPNVQPINFPDICNGMRETVWAPRGGYGANPVPGIIQNQRAARWASQAGGAPYSEGIWEDVNKALVAGLYWDSHADVFDVLKEYIASEFSPDVVDEVVAAIRILEENSQPSKSILKSAEFGVTRSTDRVPASSIEALDLMKKADGKLTAQAKTSWRWRVLYLRALIDAELYRTEGRCEGDALQQAFNELRAIYQFTEKPTYVGVPMQNW
ncbi:MAG: hypothetical protein K9M54_05845 [Kiritimatiellales bacterium]|nr:hypothetical protein [Kiritimatiellales bacterium]